MIVKDLYDLYGRNVKDPELREQVPLEGMGSEKVSWELVLTADGTLKNIVSLAHGDGKGPNRYRTMLVPEHHTRTSGINPFFLCDTAAYLLGIDDVSKEKDEAKAESLRRKAKEKRAAARILHSKVLESCDDSAAQAIVEFFSRDPATEGWAEGLPRDVMAGGNIVFALKDSAGRISLAHERPAIANAWNAYHASHGENSVTGQCSVTGEHTSLARLFPQVTGLAGAQSSGASLISFNCDSFNSYGKTQAYNASISEGVAFGAGTALKMLLADSRRRARLGDTVFTFWSDRPSPDEDAFFQVILGNPAEDAATVKRVQSALDGIKKGHPLGGGLDAGVRYYVLGISPNAARLSVRFFETATLGEVAALYARYLEDIEMVDVKTTSLFQLIRQCAVQGKYENIPSTLVNPCVRAMLTGSRFPQSLLSTLLSRMRADHGANNVWDMGQRASLIKACLVRARRVSGVSSTRESEIDVALNRDNNSVGYLLGRLFAVMERAQSEALGTTNATIRDKYIGSASITPARVMPTLMHGCQNHLSDLRKKKPGLNVILEKELDEIVGRKLSDNPYPGTLSMEDQGEFFIGYYQERVDLWTSRKQDDDASDETANNDPSKN